MAGASGAEIVTIGSPKLVGGMPFGQLLRAIPGGEVDDAHRLVDADTVAALRQFLPAAPAHNAIYLTAIEAFQEAMPGVPIVAAF